MTDLLRARLARREWTVTVEAVTPSPRDAEARARVLALTDALNADDRAAALTLTDRTTAADADPVAFVPSVLERARAAPLVHLAGKGRDAADLDRALDRCAELGVGTVLLTGGDVSAQAPVGLDALDMLRRAKSRAPQIVPLGVLALPRSVRGAVSWERAHAKREAGAEAFIAQLTWDLAEREIVAEWQARLTAPILGAVMPLTQSRLAFLEAHRISGIEIPAPLHARVAHDERGVALRRAALDLVMLRRLGYAGAHVTGIITPAVLRGVLDDAERLDAALGDGWRDVWRGAVGIA